MRLDANAREEVVASNKGAGSAAESEEDGSENASTVTAGWVDERERVSSCVWPLSYNQASYVGENTRGDARTEKWTDGGRTRKWKEE